MHYHLIKIASYIQQPNRKLIFKMVDDISEIPTYLRHRFRFKKYREVAGKPQAKFREKLVALVDSTDIDNMVLLYVLEKIVYTFTIFGP